MATLLDHSGLMDRVYRRQRHVYDATRKFYLLGRDPMLAGLRVPDGGSLLEIGCGTGRNLVKAARLYPSAALYGVDISREMLTTADRAVAAAGLSTRIRLACSDAAHFDPAQPFGRSTFDRIVISYAVSMIPQWRVVMRDAARHLAPGGELHIVDFGDLAALPTWSKAALYAWLKSFHVTPRADLFQQADTVAAELGGTAGYTGTPIAALPGSRSYVVPPLDFRLVRDICRGMTTAGEAARPGERRS